MFLKTKCFWGRGECPRPIRKNGFYAVFIATAIYLRKQPLFEKLWRALRITYYKYKTMHVLNFQLCYTLLCGCDNDRYMCVSGGWGVQQSIGGITRVGCEHLTFKMRGERGEWGGEVARVIFRIHTKYQVILP